MKKLGLLCLPVSLILLAAACSSRFTEADVQHTEADIRTQFEQKGFVVEEVNMVVDSDRHMTGYARMRKPGLLTGKLDITRNCTASRDENSGKGFWQCK
jgi:hypothetical protein